MIYVTDLKKAKRCCIATLILLLFLSTAVLRAESSNSEPAASSDTSESASAATDLSPSEASSQPVISEPQVEELPPLPAEPAAAAPEHAADSLTPTKEAAEPGGTPSAESADDVLDSVQSLLKEAEKEPASAAEKTQSKASTPNASSHKENASQKKSTKTAPKQAAAKTVLTLQECLSRALESNPTILIARRNLEKAKGVVITAKSTLYPSVNVSGRLFKENEDLFSQSDDTTHGFHDNWIATLYVQHSIFSAGVNRNTIAIAKLQNEIEYLKLHQTINDIFFEITRTFYAVLVNKSDVKTRQENVELLTEEVQRQKNLFEAGRSTKFQILRTEVRQANELPGLTDAQNKVRTSIMQLVELMGASSLDTLDTESIDAKGDLDCPELQEDLQSLIEKAIVRSPALSEQIKRKEVSRRQMLIAKASNIPRLNLFAGVSADHDGSNDNQSSFWDADIQAAAGILGTWNIFDGFEGKGKAMQAQAQMQMDEIAAQDEVRSIDFAVRRAYLDLKQAQTSVKAQQRNVQKAVESMKLSVSSVEAGFGTQFDVLQASVDLTSARNIELQARAQYHLALATLDKLLYTRVRAEVVDEPHPTWETPQVPSSSQPPSAQPDPLNPH